MNEDNFVELKPHLWGKHCRGPGCDDFNESEPSCLCQCSACKPPLQDELGKLWVVCRDFVLKQQILAAESVYQSDNVIEHAYEFVEKVCDIVGYAPFEDDEE